MGPGTMLGKSLDGGQGSPHPPTVDNSGHESEYCAHSPEIHLIFRSWFSTFPGQYKTMRETWRMSQTIGFVGPLKFTFKTSVWSHFFTDILKYAFKQKAG